MGIYHWIPVAYHSKGFQFSDDSSLIMMSMAKHLQLVVLTIAKYFISNLTRVNVGENVYCWINTRNKKVSYFASAASWISFIKSKFKTIEWPFYKLPIHLFFRKKTCSLNIEKVI